MKNYITLLSLGLLSGVTIAQENTTKLTIMPSIAWNQEKLDWNIAGDENGKNPNVLSELKWRKLRGPELGISSVVTLSPEVEAMVSISHFYITQGIVNDSDYASDNRTEKTADFDFKADRGHATSARAEIYYSIRKTEKFYLAAHTGYFGRYQTLYMLDGEQPLVVGKELKSTYKPRWHGIILGLNTAYHVDQWHVWMGISGLYFPRYSANANWNLQEEFNHPISFTHKAKGMGWEAYLQLQRQVAKAIYPFLQVGYTGLTTRTGTDQLFKADGTSLTTQLNDVNSSSFRIGLGARIQF
nr:hypothetical protein [uncultured Sphingobacterium sp.]